MKLKLVSIVIAIVVVGLGGACTSDKFEISENGFQFKYITKGAGELPAEGEIVAFNMKYFDEKDSLLFETSTAQPALVQCNTQQWDNSGPLFKAFQMLREGDSILVKVPTKTLFSESFRQPVPPTLDPEGEIMFCMGVAYIKTEEEMEDEAKKQQEIQMEKDIEIIETYLEKNNIEAQSTESGLRYVIDVEGSGNRPEPGQNVSVHYTGTLLDGTKFDASFDHSPPDPLEFPIGQQQVIAGWDEGIALLKKGGKGTLYIPSPLAYGARARSEVIKENSILKFEVELVDVR